jgi:cyanophycinase-like exopeptidase
MTKYIITGGYVHKARDGGKAFCEEIIKGINAKPIKILDCVFARNKELWEKGIQSDNLFFSKFINNFELELAEIDNFTEQVKSSDVVYLKGGYTNLLMDALSKDTHWIKELDGKVVVGSSAGADAIVAYYSIIKTNKVGHGFGLLPIKFISHWGSGHFDDEVSDTDWEGELKKLKSYKENLPTHTLVRGEFRVFEI